MEEKRGALGLLLDVFKLVIAYALIFFTPINVLPPIIKLLLVLILFIIFTLLEEKIRHRHKDKEE